MPEPDAMPSQTDQIIAAVVSGVEEGRLNPGDALEEAALAAEFGVSRTPVREALLKLEALGIVRRRPRGGATVFQPDLAEFLAILEVQARLEAQSAALAARRHDAADLAAIHGAVAECRTFLDRHGEAGGEAYYACNLAFHGAVARAARNPVLEAMVKTNARRLLAYFRARYRYAGAISRSVAEHAEIAQAIAARDEDRAEALMAAHVQFDSVTAMDLLAALAPAPPAPAPSGSAPGG